MSSQASSLLEINKRLKQSGNWEFKFQQDKCFKLNLDIYNDSRKILYSKGIAISAYRVAKELNESGEFERSLFYNEIAAAESYTKEFPNLETKIIGNTAMSYVSLGLFDKALETYKSILFIKNIDKHSIALADVGICDCFLHLDKADSAHRYCKNAYPLLMESTDKEDECLFSNISCNLGLVFDKEGKKDSAEFYLYKGLQLAQKTRDPYSIAMASQKVGQFHLNHKNVDSAVLSFKLSLKLFSQIKARYETKNIYKLLSNAYLLDNNKYESHYYLDLYINLLDSLEQKKNLSVVVGTIIRDHSLKAAQKNKMLLIFASITVLILVVVFLWFNYKNRKYLNRQKKIVKEKQHLIKVISEVKTKNEIDALGPLLELAKAKDSAFFIKFNELYPSFKDCLQRQYPNLDLNDIEFCSYLRMNLDTKEIARYADMTVKAVQCKKYRIRKKMGILSDQDLNLSIINCCSLQLIDVA